jgi:bacterioferritin
MDTFVQDVEAIRRRAREHIERGPVTQGNRADVGRVISVLNEVLATELVCHLRYKRHYYTAVGINSEAAADQFLEHAKEELEHADRIAERISQLGGDPNYDPAGLAERSHSQYDQSAALLDMIREDLVAERIAIQSYADIARWIGTDDPTTRRLMEDILQKEEEHADDLRDLLATLDPSKPGR